METTNTLRSGQAPGETVLELRSVVTELTVIKDAIFRLGVDDDFKKKLLLASEEIFVNICNFAYDAPGGVELRITPEARGISLTFIDSGRPFDPTAGLIDIEEYDHEHAIGGLGRFLTFAVADSYRYEYRDGRNILYLFFQRGGTR